MNHEEALQAAAERFGELSGFQDWNTDGTHVYTLEVDATVRAYLEARAESGNWRISDVLADFSSVSPNV